MMMSVWNHKFQGIFKANLRTLWSVEESIKGTLNNKRNASQLLQPRFIKMPDHHLVSILTKCSIISKPMDNLKTIMVNIMTSVMVSGSKVHHQEHMLTQSLGTMVRIMVRVMVVGSKVHHQEPMLIQHLANISNNIMVNLGLNKIILQVSAMLIHLVSIFMKIEARMHQEFQLLHPHQ